MDEKSNPYKTPVAEALVPVSARELSDDPSRVVVQFVQPEVLLAVVAVLVIEAADPKEIKPNTIPTKTPAARTNAKNLLPKNKAPSPPKGNRQ
jgi:hypothetical protein